MLITRGKYLVSAHSKVLVGAWRQFLGGMFVERLDAALVFPFGKPVPLFFHTFLMFTSIDVVGLRDGRIVFLEERVRPWRLVRSEKSVDCVIELPPGWIDFRGLMVGQFLTVHL